MELDGELDGAEMDRVCLERGRGVVSLEVPPLDRGRCC